MTAYDDYNASGYTRPEIVPTDWQRLAVLQTEREHIGRKLVRAGNHTHSTPTPDVDRYYQLEKLIREGIGND